LGRFLFRGVRSPGNCFGVWFGVDTMVVAGFTSAFERRKSRTMPSIHEILQRRNAERRLVGRTLIKRNALLFFRGQTGVFSCCVRDVTNSGAGIRLERLNVLPVEFDLSFDNFRTVRECRLIWRDSDFVGVTFQT